MEESENLFFVSTVPYEEIFEIKISKLSIKELETEINKAIKSENYERAAQLRDEISKRKNKK